MLGTYDRLSLLTGAKAQYTLNDPLHGVEHWLAVEAAGVEIASELDADTEIASIFGLIHDCRRQSSDADPEHGARAAELTHQNAQAIPALPVRVSASVVS